MKPTLGRIVLYHLTEHEKGQRQCPAPLGYGNDLPAVITCVHGETCINLKIFTDVDSPTVARRTSVSLGEQPGQWSWPKREE